MKGPGIEVPFTFLHFYPESGVPSLPWSLFFPYKYSKSRHFLLFFYEIAQEKDEAGRLAISFRNMVIFMSGWLSLLGL